MELLFLTVALFVAGLLAVAFGRAGYFAVVAGWRLIRSLFPAPPPPRALTTPPVAACGHSGDPVPVEVHDGFPYAGPEVSGYLCPVCFEPVPAPTSPGDEQTARRAERRALTEAGFAVFCLHDEIAQVQLVGRAGPVSFVCVECGEIQPGMTLTW